LGRDAQKSFRKNSDSPLLEKTKSTSTTFKGAANNSYEFICLATDTAGNTENQELSAEATTRVVLLPGDLNGDGAFTCADLAIVKASFGKRTGQAGFDSRADVNKDGIVDIRDLSFVARLLPAGTKCS
jgi:hypothetical protein